jgi:hypothetical protein
MSYKLIPGPSGLAELRIMDEYDRVGRKLHDAEMDQLALNLRREQVRNEIRKEIETLRAKADYYNSLAEQAHCQANNLERMTEREDNGNT